VTAASPAGVPDRSPTLDALPGFRQPPPGYGIVPFFWWLGGRGPQRLIDPVKLMRAPPAPPGMRVKLARKRSIAVPAVL